MSSAASDAAEYTIYVDGSCQDNQNVTAETPAAWGVVVVVGDNQRGSGSGEVITELSGLVITDATMELFLGAKVGSNNTAELSGVAHALRWILMDGRVTHAIIRADSQYALQIAQQNWKAKANLDLVKTVQALWEEVSSQCQLTGTWVRAHRGHKWNERADHLAFRTMQGEQPLPLDFWKPGMR
ncbi:MAG TPA: hypothetical protein HA340_03815 [Candidatus Thalassarchaeaceae archaeon]|jgi:ribonuclease HI|nr:hypothetical protein [Candidatus Thalassarchaeaceae archaeon]|tara:strand:+ start:991 stop:1542 length:552 start_codon:yes stop_codon:yes gene_type:complete